MATSIEASGNTLKISYLRFISDAAPGLVLILAAIGLHGRGVSWLALTAAGPELKTLTAVVAVLLAVPVGLVVNGLSHLLLGGIQTWVNRLCFRVRTWPMYDSHRSLLTNDWSRCFGIEKGEEHWPVMAETVDELLLVYAPPVAEALDHVRALKKFLRSMALLMLMGFMVRVASEIRNPGTWVWDPVLWSVFAGGILALALGGYITFYQQASGMMRAFILCGLPSGPKTVSLNELWQLLVEQAKTRGVQPESADTALCGTSVAGK
jgi:hypothetical protein